MLDPTSLYLTALALAKMVRLEYGSDLTLSHIVVTWGIDAGVTSEEVLAVRRAQEYLDREILWPAKEVRP